MTTLYARCAVIAALTFAPFLAARGEQLLDHLPEDALAAAVVHNISGTNAKIERVLKIFQEIAPAPIPAPLPLVKAATGLGAGLNEEGDVMLALLHNEQQPVAPRPLLLVAVSDYAAFAGSVNGDATGEICRVTIAEEEVLVAQRGSFAVLMNVEHRDRMETLLATPPRPVAALAPLAKWLAATDFAAVLTPVGVKTLTAYGRAGVSGQRGQLDQQFDDPAMADTLRQMKQSLAIFDGVLGLLDAEVSAVGLGLSIDDATNLRLTKRVVLSQDGELAKIKGVAASDQSPLAGYAAGPFVAAVGGPVPAAWKESLGEFSRKMMEQFAEDYGFEDFKAEDWQKVQSSWQTAMQGLRSMSLIVLPGEKDEPIYSNVYGIAKVDDARAYLKSYRESTTLWNELMARSSGDINLQYEMSDVKVGGREAMLMVVDVAAAAGGPNAPEMEPIMEAMFGEEGKMRAYMVVADEHTVVSGLAPEDRIAAAVEQALSNEPGLAESPSVQSAVKLLDPQAPWRAVVSPQGCVEWFSRMWSLMIGQLGGGAPTIPEYPEAPPVAFSINFDGGQFLGEMVWPVETLEGLVTFIKKCQGEF